MKLRPHILNFYTLFLFILACTGLGISAYAQYPGFGDPGSRAAGGSATGGLVPVESQVEGGEIPIGASSQVVLRFRNDGSQPVQTGLIRLYPSSTITANVSMNQCEEEPLPTGAECAIALNVKGLQSGSWRIEMLMSHSGRTRLVTATISGSVNQSGEGSDVITSDIEAIPNELNFDSLEDSQTLVEPIVLRNITSNPISIKDIYIDAQDSAGYVLKTECEVLEAGQACIAIVSWSPQLTGRSSGVLVIKHDGPTALTSVPMRGEYDPADVEEAEVFPSAVPGRGLLVSSQTEVDFGGGIETASTITVSLVNAGDVPLDIQNIRIAGSDNGLSFKPDGCAAGMTLDPIEACPLTISWSPTRVGAVFDDIQVKHSGARGILVLPVRGEATATVSQDQRAIVLSDLDLSGEQFQAAQDNIARMGDPSGSDPSSYNSSSYSGSGGLTNPAAVLDGYKITSFSPTRAIVNGPGGSRLVFNNEEVVLGGVPWFVVIKRDGIEFLHKDKRVLLLFDRSLSSINRVSASSGSTSGNSGDGG